KTENISGTPSSITHAYSSGGSYLIVVTGFDALDDTATASTSITVSPRSQPTVGITAAPANPQVNAPVTFAITAAAPTGASITGVVVNFGDNSTQNLPGNATSVQHVFTATGTYQVTATATDSNGITGSGSVVVVVGTAPPPTKPTVGITTSTTS